MGPQIKQPKQSDDSEVPSPNLWVGNFSSETTDSQLMDLFVKYGALDIVMNYSARSYMFVYFKVAEDAKAAKDALQGAILNGSKLKIEFARPARPSKHVWVGGFGPNVSKEELEEEFCKFGKVEEFRFYRDRNTAYVEYLRVDDATRAMKSMNGKGIGGEQIRVDYLRAQPSKREQGPISHGFGDGYAPISGRGVGDTSRRMNAQLGGRRGDQPSSILWVGYPSTLQIDEQMLHNAMILFGEIERIKSFPQRHYSFVEFRSVEEAWRAKEGLQGRLFNDPRITIMFSNSELGPGKDTPGSHSGFSSSFSGPLLSSGILGPGHMRGLSSQGGYDPLLSGPEYSDFHDMRDSDPQNLMKRRRPSPPLSSPGHGFRPPMRQPSAWDAYDINQIQREPKRSRIDDPLMDGVVSSPYSGLQSKTLRSPVLGRAPAGSPGLGNPDNDFIWRGIIAKGGTPVCNARCLPIGKGIGTEIPDIVNCSARTGLDMLTKHYAEAIGFDVVFFLPDSEEDFASYTEFLRYLGSKNRAGVAKFDDGTTLFLVPPSEFLTKVLKVAGPERLYGVVLKLPPQVPNVAPAPVQPPLPAHSDYNEHAYQVGYGRALPEDPKPVLPRSLGQATAQSNPANSIGATTQSGVALTPELIATLAKFLPTNSQSSTLGGAQPPLVSSTSVPLDQTLGINKGPFSQGWSQDHQAPESSGHSLQQSGNQYNPLTPSPPTHHYQSISSTPSYSAQMGLSSTQIQDSTVALPQQGLVSPRPPASFSIPSQTAHAAVSAIPVIQQYQPEIPSTPRRSYGTMYGPDTSNLYGSSAFQQSGNPNVTPNQFQSSNYMQQPHNVMQPPAADKGSLEPPNQVQQLQSNLSGAGQENAPEDVDKNQRYQSTLQFAANLLLQIQQQQQQQTNLPGGQGTGS